MTIRPPTRAGGLRTKVYPTADRLTVADEEVRGLPGINGHHATLLESQGIRTVGQLARADATRLAARIGIPDALVRGWQALGELLDVPGLGRQAAALLVRADVGGLRGLAEADGQELLGRIMVASAGAELRLEDGPVTRARLDGWIAQARGYATEAPV